MTIWLAASEQWAVSYVSVVVRPTRFSYEFMEKYPDHCFSLSCWFKRALSYLGTRSAAMGTSWQQKNLTHSSVKVHPQLKSRN